MDDDECPEPYTLCWSPIDFGIPISSFCTSTCMGDDECPMPTSGTATPVCEELPRYGICLLDCSRGDCPEGMTCVDVLGYVRCARL